GAVVDIGAPAVHAGAAAARPAEQAQQAGRHAGADAGAEEDERQHVAGAPLDYADLLLGADRRGDGAVLLVEAHRPGAIDRPASADDAALLPLVRALVAQPEC